MESYFSIQTVDQATYDTLLNFYIQYLSFKPVAAETASTSTRSTKSALPTPSTSSETSGTSLPCVRQAWLTFFGLDNRSFSLLIRELESNVSDASSVSETNRKKVEESWKLLEGNASDLSSSSLWVLHVPDIETVKSKLNAIKVKFLETIKTGSTIALTIVDPVGNPILLTTDATPFGEKSINPPQIPHKLSYTETSSSALRAALDPEKLIGSNQTSGTTNTLPEPVEESHRGSIFNLRADRKKRIGILTSGGDSSGMNAAVRAITRVALQRGCEPYAIYEGYQGLVDGGDKIKPLGWEHVRGFLSIGGTKIGTARCMEFRTREGRLKAVYNMIKNGIDALVVIGGDGSLTGADILRAEWVGLVDELVEKGELTKVESAHLRDDMALVGLVGSIDNDMSLTDMTIGAVTSLHRICESVDSLTSTAFSHQRAFVIEVMGRHCGWLGLMAGIAVGADWVCLPERPPPLNTEKYGDDWISEMCDTVHQYRSMGSRKSLVIVCEGAIDRNLKPIKPEEVRKALETRLNLDTRVTTLGHVQRGGTPCAYDRYLATVQGVEAVDAVLRSAPGVPAPMIGISQNKVTSVPLVDAVKVTHSVAKAISDKNFAKAMDLRDPDFAAAYQSYIESTLQGTPTYPSVKEEHRLRIGIIHCGAPAGGMNAATRIAGRLCINRGHTPIGIRNGFIGLVNDEVQPIEWGDMVGWQVRGGSELGSNRSHPKPIPGLSPKVSPKGVDTFIDMGQIAFHLQKHDIQALMIVGGFEAFTAALTMVKARSLYPAFCIPMVHLPATVSNNVPGTEYSVGSDTALNVIVEACDRIKLSANASRKRVFVVEVQGGNCGYLATLGGLITGATTVYIPEDGITLDVLKEDINHLCRRYDEEDRWGIPNEGRLILRSENTRPDVYDTKTISGIFRAESKGLFDSRTDVLGHLQQGGVPSPMDRIRATRLAVNCIDWIQTVAEKIRQKNEESRKSCSDVNSSFGISLYTKDDETCTTVGIKGAQVVFTPISTLYNEEADISARRTKDSWWGHYKGLIRILSKYEYFE